MWYILENEQHSYDLSDRLIRAICQWQADDGADDVDDLLDLGADVNRVHGTLLPLHCACMVGDAEIAAILLQRNALVNAIDGYGRSALHYAAERDVDCLELLIESGAELDIVDTNGDTPLHWAAFKNCVRSMVILLSHGANVNSCDFNHETPLSWAAKKSNLEVVKILLQYNATPDTIDLNDQFPLNHVARVLAGTAGGREEDGVMELLLKAMGQFDLRDADGQLPNQVASDNKLQETLIYYCENARPLKELCRYTIRSLMGPSFLPNKVIKLPIPVPVQEYLQLER